MLRRIERRSRCTSAVTSGRGPTCLIVPMRWCDHWCASFLPVRPRHRADPGSYHVGDDRPFAIYAVLCLGRYYWNCAYSTGNGIYIYLDLSLYPLAQGVTCPNIYPDADLTLSTPMYRRNPQIYIATVCTHVSMQPLIHPRKTRASERTGKRWRYDFQF